MNEEGGTSLYMLDEMTVATSNNLMRNGIRTVEELVTWSPQQLMALPNFGKVRLSNVKQSLAAVGMALQTDETLSAYGVARYLARRSPFSRYAIHDVVQLAEKAIMPRSRGF